MKQGKWNSKIMAIFYFYFHLFFLIGNGKASTTKNIQETLMEILGNKNYSKHVRPDAGTDFPTIVTVDLFLETIGEMDYMKQMPVAILVSETWTDPRLSIPQWSQGEVVLQGYTIADFWTPHLYLVSTERMKEDVYTQKIIVKPKGEITLLERTTLNLLCQKSLSTFPLDGQICSLFFKSFYYNSIELILKWNKNTIFKKTLENLEIPSFNLKGISLEERNITQFGDKFSLLEASISLARKMSLRILAVYLTSTFLVIIAWLSFWVDQQATAARVSLGLITLLTLITHNSNLVPHSPIKEFLSTDIKGLDVWLTVCLSFVFFALVEFILVNYWLTKKASQKKTTKLPTVISLVSQRKKNSTEDILSNSMVPEREVAEYTITGENSSKKQRRVLRCCKNTKIPHALDYYCRIFFPIAFIIFNIIYWIGQTY